MKPIIISTEALRHAPRALSQSFQNILRQIGTPLPARRWDMRGLQTRDELDWQCAHVSESPMIH